MNPTTKIIPTKEFILRFPKCALNVSIVDTLEAKLKLELATRNKITRPEGKPKDIRSARQIKSHKEFLDAYFHASKLLIHQEDFYEMTMAYMKKCHQQNIIHTEIIFEPQTFTSCRIHFDSVFNGINQALIEAEKKFGITSTLILNFLKDKTPEDALLTLECAKNYSEKIIILRNDETIDFKRVFAQAEVYGFTVVKQKYTKNGMLLREYPGNSNLRICLPDSQLPIKGMLAQETPLCLASAHLHNDLQILAKELTLTKKDIYQLMINSIFGCIVDINKRGSINDKAAAFYAENQ